MDVNMIIIKQRKAAFQVACEGLFDAKERSSKYSRTVDSVSDRGWNQQAARAVPFPQSGMKIVSLESGVATAKAYAEMTVSGLDTGVVQASEEEVLAVDTLLPHLDRIADEGLRSSHWQNVTTPVGAMACEAAARLIQLRVRLMPKKQAKP